MATTIKDSRGEVLRLVAQPVTTPHAQDGAKPIATDSTTVEVIVSDGRVISQGSQWGHVAIDIDGTVYGMAHSGYDIREKAEYIRSNGRFRDSIGVVLRVSAEEKEKMRIELERRRQIGAAYNLVANSCSTNVADVLESVGILAHDPRFFFAPSSNAAVSPKEVLTVVLRSKRVVETIQYRKQ